MAVVRFNEIWQDRSTDLGGRQDSKATRSWRVITDERYTREAEIFEYGEDNGKIPPLYDPHPAWPNLTARRRTCKNQSDSPLHWIVTVEYSDAPFDESDREDEPEEFDNPLLRPARISWSSSRYKEAIYVSEDGEAIINAAGDYFDPPAETERVYWVINVSKNVAAVPDWVLTVNMPINESTTVIQGLSFDAETLRLIDLQISEQKTEGLFQFYEVRLQIEYKVDGWLARPLNQGLYELFADPTVSTGKGKRRALVDGKPAVAPVLLGDDGFRLINPLPADATYMEYRINPYLDFNLLPLV